MKNTEILTNGIIPIKRVYELPHDILEKELKKLYIYYLTNCGEMSIDAINDTIESIKNSKLIDVIGIVDGIFDYDVFMPYVYGKDSILDIAIQTYQMFNNDSFIDIDDLTIDSWDYTETFDNIADMVYGLLYCIREYVKEIQGE